MAFASVFIIFTPLKMYELMKNSQYTSILEVLPVTSADSDKTKELANRFVSYVSPAVLWREVNSLCIATLAILN